MRAKVELTTREKKETFAVSLWDVVRCCCCCLSVSILAKRFQFQFQIRTCQISSITIYPPIHPYSFLRCVICMRYAKFANEECPHHKTKKISSIPRLVQTVYTWLLNSKLNDNDNHNNSNGWKLDLQSHAEKGEKIWKVKWQSSYLLMVIVMR